MAKESASYMVQLDSLRAIAAFVVIASHYEPKYFEQYNWGYAAVLLFFVLSGFLITGILLRARQRFETSRESRIESLKRFYLRRTLRIFPVYYAVALFAIFYFPEARETWGWHLTYTVNFLMAHIGQSLGATAHFWSLGVEEQFYLLWPLVILFAPLRWLVPIASAMIVVAPISRAIGLNYSHQAFALLPTSCFDSLGLGALLALYRHTHPSVQTRQLWQWPLATLGTFTALFILSKNDPSMIPVFKVAAPLLMALSFTWLIARASNGFSGLPGKILEFPPLLYLGRISYGLYIYHTFTPHISRKILHEGLGISAEDIPFHILSLLFTIAVSAVSWHFFEKPINDLKDALPAPITNDAAPGNIAVKADRCPLQQHS